MKLSRLLEYLHELDSFDRLGFAGRPDDSGIRGKGVNRQPDVRLANYPYDRDVFYGQPTDYDRGSSATGPLDNPLTPMDDTHFSLKLLGIEDPAEIEEILGSPILLTRALASDIGSTIPGVTGWSNDPPKDWDKGPEDMEEEFDPEVPETEPSGAPNIPDFRGQTDDDLENRLNRIWGADSNMNFVDPNMFAQPDAHIVGPDPWSVINHYLSSRGLRGLLPRESAWDRISGMKRKS